MEAINIHTIIEGCLVSNREARALLYQQVFDIGLPVARYYARNENGIYTILDNTYFHLLEELPFYDSTKLGFKSWVRQVVIDKGLEQGLPLAEAVYLLQVVEGYDQKDIEKRLNITEAELERHFQKAARKMPVPYQLRVQTGAREMAATGWERIAGKLQQRFPVDEKTALPFHARATARIQGGGWIGWAVLIGLCAMSLVALDFTGFIKGNKVPVQKIPVTHISAGMGFALPCPNH